MSSNWARNLFQEGLSSGLCQEACGGGLGHESTRIQDFKGNRLMVLGEMDDHGAHLFSVVNGSLGDFNKEHVHYGIISHA